MPLSTHLKEIGSLGLVGSLTGAADDGLAFATQIIHRVCCLAGSFNLVEDMRGSQEGRVLTRAIERHDTAVLFDWLAATFSYQGVSNRAAEAYMESHGSATWAHLQAALARHPSCSKLSSHWHFEGCRYDKLSRTCAQPEHIPACPLPVLRLRNGRLNQTAYSLFLFMRDIADGDFVSWIDRSLAQAAATSADSPGAMKEALIGPLRNIYGVSDKVLAMSLSTVLMAGGGRRAHWRHTANGMTAVDTLVHAFFHRTGILTELHAHHAYGPACYRQGMCADIIDAVALQIDARAFNPTFPRVFPRFVQHAIWRYCGQSEMNICNGNTVDDSDRCNNDYCSLFGSCHRVSLSKL